MSDIPPQLAVGAQKRIERAKRLRVRHSPKPVESGYIISDTVELTMGEIKRFFYSAIDIKTKFALTLPYKRLSSRNMKDFYLRFKSVCPTTIKCWQSDNGGENLGEFDEILRKDGIPHYFIYPHCYKANAYIERYNRTVQEEFINHNLDDIWDVKKFNRRLAEYLIFYNTKSTPQIAGLKKPGSIYD